MAETPEGKVKGKTRKIFKEYSPHLKYNHIPGSRFGKAGSPDYVCCVKGKYLAVECKAGDGVQTDLQKIDQGLTEGAGGIYLLVDEHSLHYLRRVIEILLKG